MWSTLTSTLTKDRTQSELKVQCITFSNYNCKKKKIFFCPNMDENDCISRHDVVMSWCLCVIVKAVTQHRLRFQQRIPSLYSSGLGRRWRKTGWKAGFHLGSVSVSSFCLFNSWKRHNEKKKPWLKLSMPQSCILTFRSLKSDTFKSVTSVLELSDWLGSYFPLFSPVSRSSTKIPGRTCQKNVAWFHCVLTPTSTTAH